jgi:hypothetical protein
MMIAKDENKKENNNPNRDQNGKFLHSSEHKTPFSSKPEGSNKYIKKTSIMDKEIGTLRSNLTRIKRFIQNVFFYIKSFFTRKKLNEIKSIFCFQNSKYNPNEGSEQDTANTKENENKLNH